MTTKNKDFHFDFNEDANPVDELHRLRVATSRHFKTMKARQEDLRATPTAQEILARLDAEIAEKKAREAAKADRPSRKPSASRPRRSAAVHA